MQPTTDRLRPFMGRPVVSSFEVVEYEPGQVVRIRTTKSTLPLDITRRVAARPDGGATLKATIRGEPQGAMKLFNGLTRRMVKRNVDADYDRLKVLLNEMHSSDPIN